MEIKIALCICGLLLIFILGRKLCCRNIVAPQTINAISFIPSLFLLLFYAKDWNAELSNTTIGLILSGPLIFLIVSVIFKAFKIKVKECKNDNNMVVKIDFPYAVMFTVIEIITLLLLFRYIISFVGSAGSISTLLMTYRFKSATADLPTITSLFRLVSVYSGYVWAYLLCLNKLEKIRNNNTIYIINFFLSILISLSSGARGTAIMLIISLIVQYVFLFNQKMKITNEYKKMNSKYKKSIIIITVCLVLFAFQFDKFANILGRDTSEFTGIYYLAIYLAAPIKNLDIFIRNDCFGFAKGFWDSHIFNQLLTYVGTKYFDVNMSAFVYPFNVVNGQNLGNVATAYADYYYDNAMLSFIIANVLMAIITNYFFAKSNQSYNCCVSEINVYAIIYSIMAFGIAFNFFANEFYICIFNIEFFRGIIVIMFIKYFFTKRNIKKKSKWRHKND